MENRPKMGCGLDGPMCKSIRRKRFCVSRTCSTYNDTKSWVVVSSCRTRVVGKGGVKEADKAGLRD